MSGDEWRDLSDGELRARLNRSGRLDPVEASALVGLRARPAAGRIIDHFLGKADEGPLSTETADR